MKTIFKQILFGASLALLASCADLDIVPLSELASGNWYTTETEIKMSIDDWYRPDFFQIDEFYWSDDWCMIGFSYGQLATYFGDCVLAKSAMTLDESYEAKRSPRAEVMAYAYECLNKAAGLLPESYSGQKRLTKGAALGFLSRFALQVGDWAVAVEACKKCMDLGVYSLTFSPAHHPKS